MICHRKKFIFFDHNNKKINLVMEYEYPNDEIIDESLNEYKNYCYNSLPETLKIFNYYFIENLEIKYDLKNHISLFNYNCDAINCNEQKYIITLFQNIFPNDIINIILQWIYFFDLQLVSSGFSLFYRDLIMRSPNIDNNECLFLFCNDFNLCDQHIIMK